MGKTGDPDSLTPLSKDKRKKKMVHWRRVQVLEWMLHWPILVFIIIIGFRNRTTDQKDRLFSLRARPVLI